jgi:aspartyl protease family protein
VLDSVDIDGKAASDVRGSVIEGLDISLLGQAYLSELEKVEISGDEMVLR